jgi:hypothetical protein
MVVFEFHIVFENSIYSLKFQRFNYAAVAADEISSCLFVQLGMGLYRNECVVISALINWPNKLRIVSHFKNS